MAQLALFTEIATYVRHEILDRIDKSGDARLTFLELPLEISGGDWSNNNRIGAGAFGTVYKAKWTFPRTSCPVDVAVAVKILDDLGSKDEKALVKDFRQEARIWALVPPHTNVLPLIGIYFRDNDRKRGLISPLATGDLMSSLQNEEHRTYRERFQLVRDVAEGLKHLHENGIIHGDLQTGNIFIVDNSAVLGDFGQSQLAAFHAATPRAGSGLHHLSQIIPELRNNPWNTSNRTDVYSFGLAARVIMTTGIQPVQAGLFGDILNNHGLRQLWEQCLVNDPEVRPANGAVIVERIGNLAAIPESVVQ